MTAEFSNPITAKQKMADVQAFSQHLLDGRVTAFAKHFSTKIRGRQNFRQANKV
jgi:gentisate 1,2-dioxygenase